MILIGSGVSANAATDTGLRPPTWGKFLHEAYARLGRNVRHIKLSLKKYDYLEACDFLRGEFGASWHDVIRDSFVTPNYRPASIHKAIFDLDSRIVMSLNFDRIYEGYAHGASEGTIIVKNYHDVDVRQTIAGPDRYIIKPHGTVDSISKMIFTLDDYGKARIEYAGFYDMITALLHTHTFLCIGCGLSDPDMQLLFENYRYRYSESPHYIVLPLPISKEECSLIQKTRGLNVLTYPSKDNHKELTESLRRLGDDANLEREQIAATRNW